MPKPTPRFAFAALLIPLFVLLLSERAQAVPDLAAQTGQPCTMCHVGGFGPQLTPFGRAFKIGGYTQTGGEGLASQIPLSLMVQSSFNHTSADLEADQIPRPHYAANNNFSIDQVSGFIAGGLGPYTGGFMQFTYSPVDNTSAVDNTDLRPFTTVYSLRRPFAAGRHHAEQQPDGAGPLQLHLRLGLPVHLLGNRADADRRRDAGLGLLPTSHRLHGLCLVRQVALPGGRRL